MAGVFFLERGGPTVALVVSPEPDLAERVGERGEGGGQYIYGEER